MFIYYIAVGIAHVSNHCYYNCLFRYRVETGRPTYNSLDIEFVTITDNIVPYLGPMYRYY